MISFVTPAFHPNSDNCRISPLAIAIFLFKKKNHQRRNARISTLGENLLADLETSQKKS